MAKIISDPKVMQAISNEKSKAGANIGFVPTMGNLHAGHLSLLKRCASENKTSILSIFLNPTQFNNSADLEKYPRTLEKDIELAAQCGVDYIFTPTFKAIYPDNYQYTIIEKELSQQLEGKFRPGHFDGVLTVVMKLLMITKPDKAYFGEKDRQQLMLLQGLAKAFFIDTDIIPCKTVREDSQLAFSSRNNLLAAEHKSLAPNFYKLLSSTKNCQDIAKELTHLGFVVDYIEDYNGHRFGSAYLGNVRLIDNVPLTSRDTLC